MKTLIPLFFVLLFVMLADSANAQSNKQSLEQKIIKSLPKESDTKFLTIAIENDLFASGQDHDYTSGFRLGWFEAGLNISNFSQKIANIYPAFKINRTTSMTYSIGQNLYTPENISIGTLQTNDRPWAAWLYGSLAMTTVSNNHVEEMEISAGAVGPMAIGEQTQKFIHKYISNSDEPKGWDNQLKNEVGVILAWQRRWPEYWTHDFDDLWISAAPQFGVNLGNIYTHAEAGLNFRLSPKTERFSDMPLRVRPSMAGTGYFPKPYNKFSWSLFGGINARAVGRNIFLDGNSFQNSHHVNKKKFVYDLNVGFDVTYNRNRVSYTIVRRSKEFYKQDNNSVFGAISLSRRF